MLIVLYKVCVLLNYFSNVLFAGVHVCVYTCMTLYIYLFIFSIKYVMFAYVHVEVFMHIHLKHIDGFTIAYTLYMYTTLDIVLSGV